MLVGFDPAAGSESAKTRPAVVASNNVANHAAARTGRGVVTVVPMTSNIARVLPFQVLLPAATTGLTSDSKAQAEQVRVVSVTRIARPVGWVDAELMGEVDEALRLHLSL